MNGFRTHKGDYVTGQELQKALNAVAADYEQLADDIRAENAYAPHVSEATKEENRQGMKTLASRIRAGEVSSFTVWQRINSYLTGECVAFIP